MLIMKLIVELTVRLILRLIMLDIATRIQTYWAGIYIMHLFITMLLLLQLVAVL